MGKLRINIFILFLFMSSMRIKGDFKIGFWLIVKGYVYVREFCFKGVVGWMGICFF